MKARVWEIDEFFGENRGLVVAEVELTSEDQTCRYVFEEQSSMKGAALLGRKHLLERTGASL